MKAPRMKRPVVYCQAEVLASPPGQLAGGAWFKCEFTAWGPARGGLIACRVRSAARRAAAAVVFAALLLECSTGPLLAAEPRDWATAHLPELVALYQHLHQHPELSRQEEQTAARLAQELRAVGAEVTTGVGGHGVVALLHNGEGPSVMLRADMDALPVVEQTGLVYQSTVTARDDQGAEVGVMHACGHDIHMTCLVGVVRFLAEHRDTWHGTLMAVCQPAEERGGGAKAMLEDGLFTRFPRPALALALHCDSTLPTGQIGYRAGYTLANVDSVDVVLIGRGGHGAYPHATIDPVVMAAHLIVDLQTVVAREVPPTDPAVITVGSIHAGSKHNIIGDRCHLQLTLRSYTDKVRDHLQQAVTRKARAVAMSFRAPEPEVAFSEGTPAMFNDEQLVERALPSLRRAVGEENVVLSEPAMGGEDFSEYGRAGVPIFMFRLGAVDRPRLASYVDRGLDPPSLHSAQFYPDTEPTLLTGVSAMSQALVELLQP